MFVGLSAFPLTYRGYGDDDWYGGGSLISISRGEANYEKSHLIVSTSLWLSVFLGILISIILYLFGVYVLQLQGAEDEVFRLGSEYVSVFSCGAIFTVVSAALPISVCNMMIQLPFLYLLPSWFGIDGIWLSVPLSNLVLSFIIVPILWNDVSSKRKLSKKMATY